MNQAVPLIQTITPERWIGVSMSFIDAGYIGLLVKNGQLVRKLEPGRHFSYAMPYLEQCQILLVDSKIRNLEVSSQGDFVSRDQYLVNIALSVMYQVVDPKRVALELSDPIAALTSAVKDNLAVVVNQMKLEQLNQVGRVHIRDYLLSHLDSFYTLGFNLDDVRVSDISFPQKQGVIRQLEGLTARAEADHEAIRQAQIASSERSERPERTVHLHAHGDGMDPVGFTPLPNSPTPIARKPLPATTLAADGAMPTACLIHGQTGEPIAVTTTPFTIGREPENTLVLSEDLCSRRHARIERRQTVAGEVVYQITDVGSSNGTLLNGNRLVPNQPMPLKPDDRIKIGATEWIFSTAADGGN